MRKILLLLIAVLPLMAMAKDNNDNTNPKYLAGAIKTDTNGKVSFKKTIAVNNMSKDEIYNHILTWANDQFKSHDGMKSRVVYSNREEGQIAATAEEYIVFSSSALSLDRSRIYYHLFINIDDNQCEMDMTRIRYWYEENRDGGEKYSAEGWITDDMALNKKKTKLAPMTGKFRRETIDLKDNLFKSASMALGIYPNAQVNQYAQMNQNAQPSASQNAQGAAVATATVIPAATLQPAKKINASANKNLEATDIEQLPTNLSELIAAGKIALEANGEKIDVNAECWGGFGKLFNKDVTYTIVDQSKMMANVLLKNSEKFSIMIYAQGEEKAMIVIECKKPMLQEMSAEDLKSLNPNITANKKYNMYIGEVTKVMMR